VGKCTKAVGPSFPSAECAGMGNNDYLRRDQCVHWFVHYNRAKPYFPIVLFMNEVFFIRMGFSTATAAIFGQ